MFENVCMYFVCMMIAFRLTSKPMRAPSLRCKKRLLALALSLDRAATTRLSSDFCQPAKRKEEERKDARQGSKRREVFQCLRRDRDENHVRICKTKNRG